jgi:hypothetical protein
VISDKGGGEGSQKSGVRSQNGKGRGVEKIE